MVFTVTDLGGVFHLRTVGRSNDMYSGCTTAFNYIDHHLCTGHVHENRIPRVFKVG